MVTSNHQLYSNSKLKHIINLEGIDGTGKHTVSLVLRKIFQEMGFMVSNVSFPVYESPTGKLIKSYLSGELVDDPTKIDPIMASLYYVLDRMTYFKNNPQLFTDYDVLIFDRSYMSNFFFQAAKYIDNYTEFTDALPDIGRYIRLMYQLEIEATPLKNFVDIMNTVCLYHPNISTNFKLMKKRFSETATTDLHESNTEYLTKTHNNALALHKHIPSFPSMILTPYEIKAYSYTLIECSDKETGELKQVPDIATDILKKLYII